MPVLSFYWLKNKIYYVLCSNCLVFTFLYTICDIYKYISCTSEYRYFFSILLYYIKITRDIDRWIQCRQISLCTDRWIEVLVVDYNGQLKENKQNCFLAFMSILFMKQNTFDSGKKGVENPSPPFPHVYKKSSHIFLLVP